jgi:hypothetical protein
LLVTLTQYANVHKPVVVQHVIKLKRAMKEPLDQCEIDTLNYAIAVAVAALACATAETGVGAIAAYLAIAQVISAGLEMNEQCPQ